MVGAYFRDHVNPTVERGEVSLICRGSSISSHAMERFLHSRCSRVSACSLWKALVSGRQRGRYPQPVTPTTEGT